MLINRRVLLTRAAEAGGMALVGSGVLGWRAVRRHAARSEMQRSLMAEAVPLLNAKAISELEELPAQAREEMREYFHGVCLNVHSFVAEICSKPFARRLRQCRRDDDRHRLLNIAFSQKVVTATEILNRVEAIAEESGAVLNRNWNHCCTSLADAWNITLSASAGIRQALDIGAIVEPLIRQDVEQARLAAYPAGQRPLLIEPADVGKTALLLLPVLVIEAQLALPVFFVAAAYRLWTWVLDQLANREADYQTAITERLATFGNRVGNELEREFRQRIADLHHWQEASLNAVARDKACELIPALI